MRYFLLVIEIFAYLLFAHAGAMSDKVEIPACCSPLNDKNAVNAYQKCSIGAPPIASKFYPKIFLHRNRTIVNERNTKMIIAWKDIPVVSRANSKPSDNINILTCVPTKRLKENFLFIEDGSLWVIDLERTLPDRDYCYDRGTDEVQLCRHRRKPESFAESSALVDQNQYRICCGFNGHFLQSNNYCESKSPLSNSLRKSKTSAITKALGKSRNDFSSGFPVCSENITHFYFGEFKEFLFDAVANRQNVDGVLHWPKFNINISLDHICFEYFNNEVQVLACLEGDYLEKNEPVANNVLFYLYPIGLYIGAFFLLITLVISYVLLPNTHHILHWKCQTNYVLFLFIGTVFLATHQLANSRLIHNRFLCTLIAVTMHFSFLSAFFWLNTMCFNIWWTFRDIRPNTLEKWQEKCRLRAYELYAWGIPFLITMSALIMDSMPNYPEFLRPKFCEKSCWFYGDSSIVTYFFGPISILLTVNLVLFFATAHELSCGLWKGEFVKSTSERTTLGQICLKLVVVMGVTWIFDVISWFAYGPIQLWILTDFLNCLQGLFIFCVIGSQPHVWPVMKKKFSCFANLLTLCCPPRNKHSEMIEEITTHNDPRHSFEIPEITSENVTWETMC